MCSSKAVRSLPSAGSKAVRPLYALLLLIAPFYLTEAPTFAQPAAIPAADQVKIVAIIRATFPGAHKRETDTDPAYSASLKALIKRWKPAGQGDEVYRMNDFGWWCQCQDEDPKTSKLISSRLTALPGNRVDAAVIFTPGWKDRVKAKLRLVKEQERWLVDDLVFEDGTTLRQGLTLDIADWAKDQRRKAVR
jgi:hypothetical protein